MIIIIIIINIKNPNCGLGVLLAESSACTIINDCTGPSRNDARGRVTGTPPAHIRVTHLASSPEALASYWSTLTPQDHTDVISTTLPAAHWIKMTSLVYTDVTRDTSGLRKYDSQPQR